ncbi:MAG: NUDIX domain-containing protein [Treponema sp.]|jgi:8-oxo-dGTP diphosphatase|nr:NUDIX domain-containing protein [Treponema sp.]
MRECRSVAGIALEGAAVFVARRKAGGDLGGKWEFPGGKAEEGESDQEALVREYGEEFAVPVEVGPFLGAASFEHGGRSFSLNAYRIRFVHTGFRAAEHEEWRWVPLEEIKQLDFAPSDLLLLPLLQTYLEGQPRVQDVERRT